VEPEIPNNTGSIARTCAATGAPLHLVKPLGFKTDDKHLKRAGLDYWQYVEIYYWDSLTHFIEANRNQRFFLFTKKAEKLYTDAAYQKDDFLIFGGETRGLPDDFLALHWEQRVRIPIFNPRIRSLNLAASAAIALYEAIRQTQT
jgi:tRNA (cytidine/uridine-2'-O-)-methyltransferase